MPNEKKPGKLPDLNELMTMIGKFFCDMKQSAAGIMNDYHAKRSAAPPPPKAKSQPKPGPKPPKKPAPKPAPKAPTYEEEGRSEGEEEDK